MENRSLGALLLLVVLLASAPLAACGGVDSDGDPAESGVSSGQEAAVARAQEPGCRAQRQPSTYAPAGLREIKPPGTNARQLRANLGDRIDQDASEEVQDEAGLKIYSLGDRDSTGEAGEAIDPDDQEDVAVLHRPLTPGGTPADFRDILKGNVRSAEATFRAQAKAEGQGVTVEVDSTVGDRVAFTTGTFKVDGADAVRERLAFAFTDCSLIEVVGWPTQVTDFLRVATRAKP